MTNKNNNKVREKVTKAVIPAAGLGTRVLPAAGITALVTFFIKASF